MKVKKNLEYIHKENDKGQKIVEDIIDSLTSSLKNQLSLELYTKIISNLKAFQMNFSPKFLSDLSLVFKESIIS